jgi:cytoskeleton protein RodZ
MSEDPNPNSESIEEDFIQSPGEMLRQARLAKELSISEISRATRISKAMVEALENGECDKLPGRTYETGYIKLICRVTNTDPDPIIKKWVDEYYSNKDLDPYIFPETKIPKENSNIVMFGLILSLLIIFGYAYWYFYTLKFSEEKNIKVNNNDYSINLLSETGDNKTHQKDDGSLLQNNNFDNKSNILEKNIADISPNSSLKNGTQGKNDNLIKNTVDDNVANLDNSSLLEAVQDNSSLLEEAQVNNSNQGFDIFELENYENFNFVGIKDSWVQIIHLDGEMFYSGMLKSGHNLIIPNNESLLITLGNSGAVGIDIIDIGIQSIGKSGEIIQAVKLDYILNKIRYKDEN